MKPTLDVQKGYELIITEQTKEVTLNTFKSQLGPKMKYYTNAYKTEFIQAGFSENEQIKSTVKIIYVYTKQ